MINSPDGRDQAATVEEYVGFFNEGFRGATGAVDAIDRAASAYGVFYQGIESGEQPVGDADGDLSRGHTEKHTASGCAHQSSPG